MPYSDSRLWVGLAGVGEWLADPFSCVCASVSGGCCHGEETRGGSGSKVKTDIA